MSTRSSWSARSVLLAGILFAGTALSGPAFARADDPVKRERAELASMELKPFAADLLSGLADWQNSGPIDAAAIKGKPVLIVTWTAWIPSSQDAVERAAAAAAKNPDLVVILAHADNRFELASKFLEGKSIKLPSARDVGGKLRAGLKSDADPDLYFIDRAGNLRFADVETNSLAPAVAAIVGETADDAAKLPQLAADRAKQAELEAARTRGINTVQPGEELRVDFQPPSAAEYAKVIWPAVNQDKDINQFANNSMQGQVLPIKFGTEYWFTPKPEMAGKIVVLNFWSTVDDPNIQIVMDGLARAHRSDVVVIGVSGMKSSEDNFDSRIAVERALRKRPVLEHAHMYDTDQKIYSALQLRAWPFCIVLSTDGVVRWAGFPLDPEFTDRVRTLVAIDPGVAARRAAEAKARAAKGHGG